MLHEEPFRVVVDHPYYMPLNAAVSQFAGYTLCQRPVYTVWDAEGRLLGEFSPDGIPSGLPLGEMHNPGMTVGEYIHYSLIDNPTVKVLRKGHIVQ